MNLIHSLIQSPDLECFTEVKNIETDYSKKFRDYAKRRAKEYRFLHSTHCKPLLVYILRKSIEVVQLMESNRTCRLYFVISSSHDLTTVPAAVPFYSLFLLKFICCHLVSSIPVICLHVWPPQY